jgi:hypothetical protein
MPTFRHYPAVTRLVAVVGVGLVAVLAYRAYGWPGLALAGGGLVMWALMHMTRMLLILRRTANRPVGTVASAVMLHARLHRGMTLLQVLGLTRALGQRIGAQRGSPRSTNGAMAQTPWCAAPLATAVSRIGNCCAPEAPCLAWRRVGFSRVVKSAFLRPRFQGNTP